MTTNLVGARDLSVSSSSARYTNSLPYTTPGLVATQFDGEGCFGPLSLVVELALYSVEGISCGGKVHFLVHYEAYLCGEIYDSEVLVFRSQCRCHFWGIDRLLSGIWKEITSIRSLRMIICSFQKRLEDNRLRLFVNSVVERVLSLKTNAVRYLDSIVLNDFR